MEIEVLSKDRPNFALDLKDVARNITTIAISDKTKGLHLVHEFNFKKVWLICLNQKKFEQVIQHISPEYLNIYGCRVKDLSSLEQLTNVETIVSAWNTKAEMFWDFSKHKKLKQLHVSDMTKIKSLEELKNASLLDYLTIEGGFNTTWKIISLAALASLQQLKYLNLGALNVLDKSLQPLSTLTNLEKLRISNQFPTAEFARLSTQLKTTKCDKFQPFTKVEIEDENRNIVYDRMITGSRKPFLNSKKDTVKIEKYVQKFNHLVASFEKNTAV